MKFKKTFRLLSTALLISLLALIVPAKPALAVGVIQLSVYQGSVGQEISITGTGFTANDPATLGVNIIFSKSNPPITIAYTIHIHELLKTVPLDINGSFTSTFKVPANLTGANPAEAVTDGTYYVLVTYYYPPPAVPNYGPNVIDSVSFTVTTPAVTADPLNGQVGSAVKINGTGFSPGQTISLEYDGQAIASTGTTATTATGAFSDATIIIPPGVTGEHTIKVTDASLSSSAETKFTVNPSIKLSPRLGTASTSVSVSGSGFAAATEVVLYFDGQPTSSGTSDAQGSFSGSFVPTTDTVGDYVVIADDGLNSAESTFSVTAVDLTVSPLTGQKDTLVNVTGNRYLPGRDIDITFNEARMALPKSNSNGGFAVQFKVPESAPGTYKIQVTDGSNISEVDFVIPDLTPSASGSISPLTSVGSPGRVGDQLTLSGGDYIPNETITITYDGATLATAIVNADGEFSVVIDVPKSVSGDHTIVVTGSQTTSNPMVHTFVMESAPPAAPPLLEPDTEVEAEPEAFLDWQDVEDLSGLSYTLQIATDENFTALAIILDEADIDASEYTVPVEDRLLSVSPEAPYYWRVRAVDKAGNEGPWSSIRSFYVGSSFAIAQGVIYALIGVGSLLLAGFAFWMGRKTAYY